MAREIIRVDSTASVTTNVGNGNSYAQPQLAGDNNLSTLSGWSTQDSTGTETSYIGSFKAASTKSKTWAKYRAFVKMEIFETDGTGSTHTGGYIQPFFKDPTGAGVTQTVSTLTKGGGGGSGGVYNQYTALVSGNPTITASTTQIFSLEHLAYAQTGGSTDIIEGWWYELFLEGFSAPTITSINGGSPIQEGADVVIVGTEFDSSADGGGNGVTLSAGFTSSGITYTSDTSITVQGVKGGPGSCTFTVTTNGGSVNASQQVDSAKFFALLSPIH